MPEKEPQNVDGFLQILPFIIAVSLSCLGGIVGYLNRIDKHGISFSFLRLTLEIFTSGFVGIISFMFCDAAELDWKLTAALVAISGHMGTRALSLFEETAVDLWKTLTRRFVNGNSEAEISRKEQSTKGS